jgi:hypothetical protein
LTCIALFRTRCTCSHDAVENLQFSRSRSRRKKSQTNHHDRAAFDLASLTLSTRMSGLEPTVTRMASLEELDYLDVFEFFNVPKIKLEKLETMVQVPVDHGMMNNDAWIDYRT